MNSALAHGKALDEVVMNPVKIADAFSFAIKPSF